jgi:hypothetical protein
MACEEGTVRVIGSVGWKKHEKKTNDSRVPITMYRTGTVAGDTGPTTFLMKGIYRKNCFTDKGLRTINKYVAANPQWFMLQVFDGFGVHLASLLPAMQERFDNIFLSLKEEGEERFDNKILSLKEEGDSSHVNQAYDKFVAKSDTVFKAESLSMLRSSFYSCGVLSQ